MSMINADQIQEHTLIDTQDKVILRGVFGQEKLTGGAVRAQLRYKGEIHRCKFQVVTESINVEEDGILGMDFLAGRAVID